MKLSKSQLALAFVAFAAWAGAVWAGDSALAETAKAPHAAAAAIPYEAVVDLPADCAVKPAATTLFDPNVCSTPCSQALCKGKDVNSPCGFGGGGSQRFCYELGDVCSDGPACRCTNVPP